MFPLMRLRKGDRPRAVRLGHCVRDECTPVEELNREVAVFVAGDNEVLRTYGGTIQRTRDGGHRDRWGHRLSPLPGSNRFRRHVEYDRLRLGNHRLELRLRRGSNPLRSTLGLYDHRRRLPRSGQLGLRLGNDSIWFGNGGRVGQRGSGRFSLCWGSDRLRLYFGSLEFRRYNSLLRLGLWLRNASLMLGRPLRLHCARFRYRPLPRNGPFRPLLQLRLEGYVLYLERPSFSLREHMERSRSSVLRPGYRWFRSYLWRCGHGGRRFRLVQGARLPYPPDDPAMLRGLRITLGDAGLPKHDGAQEQVARFVQASEAACVDIAWTDLNGIASLGETASNTLPVLNAEERTDRRLTRYSGFQLRLSFST